jgi:hypothetical protein
VAVDTTAGSRGQGAGGMRDESKHLISCLVRMHSIHRDYVAQIFLHLSPPRRTGLGHEVHVLIFSRKPQLLEATKNSSGDTVQQVGIQEHDLRAEHWCEMCVQMLCVLPVENFKKYVRYLVPNGGMPRTLY